MPELPDVTVYLDAIGRHVLGRTLQRVNLVSPFVLRSVEPPLAECSGKIVRAVRRIGKRIAFELDGDLCIVIHLMIAGRFKWHDKTPGLGRRLGCAAKITRSSARSTLTEWIARLRAETRDSFPEKVTAFRPQMAVHGKFHEPCSVCGTPVQRIRYADNETDYCPTCQSGKLLADRRLSCLLKKDWPKSLDEMDDAIERHQSRAAEPE